MSLNCIATTEMGSLGASRTVTVNEINIIVKSLKIFHLTLSNDTQSTLSSYE